MRESRPACFGNILGSARAEADMAMLAKAFVETADYRALLQTDDFNFVVGRRGTGKSALFYKLKEHYSDTERVSLICVTPAEHETMQLQALLQLHSGSSYRQLRAVSRLVWKAHLLLTAAKAVLGYRSSKTTVHQYLTTYLETHSMLASLTGAAQCAAILKTGVSPAASDVQGLPARLASILDLEQLKIAVDKGLREQKQSVLVMYDGLDEGWEPAAVSSTAILGGLAIATADLVDADLPIRPLLFVRDNMFRALADVDSDFTRHIEGNTLRLHWDEQSLFHLAPIFARA